MSQSRVVDASGTPVPNSPMQLTDLDGMGTRSGSTTDEKLDALLSNFVHFETQIAQIPALTTWMSRVDSHITKTLGDFATRLAEMEKNFSTFTARLCKVESYAPSAYQMYPVRQDPGFHSNKFTAPQPQGPMAQDHLMTIGIRDADYIFPQALRMNVREVRSYHGSHANNIRKRVRSGSIIFGENPTSQPTMNLLPLIVRQVPCRSGLSLKHEANVKTSLLEKKMMVFPMRLTVLFAASKQRLLSANPDQLRTERSASNLHPCGECWLTNSNFSSLMG